MKQTYDSTESEQLLRKTLSRQHAKDISEYTRKIASRDRENHDLKRRLSKVCTCTCVCNCGGREGWKENWRERGKYGGNIEGRKSEREGGPIVGILELKLNVKLEMTTPSL